MKLSVIILNYNVRFFLEQCVLSVQKALGNIDGEIIVVDNNSQDDSCIMMKEKFPDVKLIENKENFGFPKGNNVGVAKAKGEYVCILNPDTVVAEDTFTKILETEHWKLNTGIIGCKLIDGTGNFLPECKRGVPTPWVAFTKIFSLYKLFPKLSWFNQYYAQHLSQDTSGEVDILVGAFFFMKRQLYVQMGGFDENCFMYSDDIDLCYLVKKAGYKNFYFHQTSIIHYKGESSIRDEKYVKRFREAMQFFYKKHFGGSIFFDFIMYIGAFFFSLFKQKQQKGTLINIDKTILFSKENCFHPNLKYDEVVTSFKDFSKDVNQTIEIIFDTRSFDFKSIIAFMEENKDEKLLFKNYIYTSQFLIGSNSPNEMGKIVCLEIVNS